VLNQQREVVYGIRNAAIHAERSKDIIFEQVEEEVANRLALAGFGEKGGSNAAAVESFVGWANTISRSASRSRSSPATTPGAQGRDRRADQEGLRRQGVAEIPEALGSLERYVVINAIDHHWQEHLTEMEELRRSIGLRSYGQKDPLVEYKGEAYRFFEELMTNVRLQICTGLFRSASNLSSFENMLSILARKRPDPGAGERARRPPGGRRARPPTGGPGAAAPLPRGRAGDAAAQGDPPPRHPQGGAQRSVPLRQRQEVQALPRSLRHPPEPGSVRSRPDASGTGTRMDRAGRRGRADGLLLVVAFPPFQAPEAAYACLAPGVFWAYLRPRLRVYAWTMFAAQAVAWTINLSWLHPVTWVGLFVLGPLVGAWTGSWYLAAWWTMPRMLGRPTPVRLFAMLGLAGTWVLIEWTRTWVFGGFPWMPLAATQWEMRSVLQVAAYTGAYGVSFVLVA
jgi:hypothetical protein